MRIKKIHCAYNLFAFLKKGYWEDYTPKLKKNKISVVLDLEETAILMVTSWFKKSQSSAARDLCWLYARWWSGDWSEHWNLQFFRWHETPFSYQILC